MLRASIEQSRPDLLMALLDLKADANTQMEVMCLCSAIECTRLRALRTKLCLY